MDHKARNIVTLGSFLAIVNLNADSFHPIASISSNTAATDFYPANRLIAGPGAGFEVNPPHNSIGGAAAAAIWVTDACGFPCDYYLTKPTPILTIDLGNDQPLDEISFWGYSNQNSNGAKKASLRFATDLDGTSNFGTTITFSPALSLLNDQTTRQSFSFGQTITARYIEVTLTDNHFIAPGDGSMGELPGGDRVGLGEIAFSVPVPNNDPDQLLVTSPNDFSLKSGTIGNPNLAPILDSLNYWAIERSKVSGIYYLSVPTDGKIYRVDPGTSPLTLDPLVDIAGSVFHGIAINEQDNLLYVADSATDTILKCNLNTGALAGSIGTGFKRPNEVIFSREIDRIIVSDSGNDAIYLYNMAGTLEKTFSDASTIGAWGLALDPQTGELLYSSHDKGEIYRRDLTSGLPTTEHSNLKGPRGLKFDRRGTLYCVESGNNRVTTFGSGTPTNYVTAPGGRDLSILAACDLDGDFLPDEWEALSGGSSLTFLGDADGDGVFNAIEAATGGSTSTSNDANPVKLSLNPEGEFTLTLQALKKSSLQYTIWLSDDLNNWQEVQTLPSVTSGTGLHDTWTFRFAPEEEGFPADTPRLFSQLSLSTGL